MGTPRRPPGRSPRGFPRDPQRRSKSTRRGSKRAKRGPKRAPLYSLLSALYSLVSSPHSLYSLLSALRLQCMTPAELYLHCGPTQRLAEGATSAVAFVSAHNEWHALRRAVELTSLCPAAARVARA